MEGMAFLVNYEDHNDQQTTKIMSFDTMVAAEAEAEQLRQQGFKGVTIISPRRNAANRNWIGFALKIFGILFIVGGLIAGIITGKDSVSEGFDKIIAVEWWVLGAMIGAFFYGIGEIIKLLDLIYKRNQT
ncbi:hypothetical protein J2Z69_000482 [Paenibacillus shirakamiensis]|uniref:Uncharacterized protein n=1 Tax=Paenibacillus shirakamiensis TaxID=1265935 RepID=A0ABS4JCN5_9BACL|nr:hypothetical protein [Paenibacillus shirakamiensis]MBP1999463.1 hypothetical protein [Paenibacillus shirakamiensis]